MRISPDEVIIWHGPGFDLNLTLLTTWLLMAAMAGASRWVTRGVSSGPRVARRQTGLEIIVLALKDLISGVGLQKPEKYIGFIGTLFLFIAVSNLSTVIPYYEPPTGSYSTTAALAVCVFAAVPAFGISELGFFGYLKTYIQPTFLMMPFHVISQITRTLALATRLFGNIMSGSMVLALIISIAPLIFPVAIIALGLLTGIVQAYIFTILAAVFITAATHEE